MSIKGFLTTILTVVPVCLLSQDVVLNKYIKEIFYTTDTAFSGIYEKNLVYMQSGHTLTEIDSANYKTSIWESVIYGTKQRITYDTLLEKNILLIYQVYNQINGVSFVEQYLNGIIQFRGFTIYGPIPEYETSYLIQGYVRCMGAPVGIWEYYSDSGTLDSIVDYDKIYKIPIYAAYEIAIKNGWLVLGPDKRPKHELQARKISYNFIHDTWIVDITIKEKNYFKVKSIECYLDEEQVKYKIAPKPLLQH